MGIFISPDPGRYPTDSEWGGNHPQVIAFITFFLLCLLVGFLVHTAIGKVLGRILGDTVFNRVPGYQSLRNIARQFGDMEANNGFKQALIEVEDGCLAPAFLIENHDNGQSTVFMPSVPTPMAGSIFIMPSDRVHPVDVPVATMMKCISKWGAGSAEILAALPHQEARGEK